MHPSISYCLINCISNARATLVSIGLQSLVTMLCCRVLWNVIYEFPEGTSGDEGLA